MTITDDPLGDLARALRAGEVEPSSHLDRVHDRFDDRESSIQAFLPEEDRWDRLERTATSLETQYSEPGTRPPLYGVPVGVKDIFHVDGFPTKAGADVPPETITGPQAATISALREAGALVLGKTVTTEFAYFAPGPTRNPHDLARTPGGSSSGSAAAVAAGLCPLALGSQTIGSVIRPASFCGIVGVKPSYGRVSIDGVVPVAPSVDHVGWFTQDLAGAHLAAGVLCDDWCAEEPSGVPRVGAVEGPYLEQASETGQSHFEVHIERLTAAGLEVRRIDPFLDLEAVNRRHERLVAAETALSHSEWYPALGDRYAPETSDLIEEGLGVEVDELAAARAGRRALREEVHEAMTDRGIDVLVSPAAPGPAPEGIDSTGDPIMNLPWTHAGLPTVTLPASTTDDGLPLGLQCTARFGADEHLFAWCRAIEAALA